MYVYQPRTEDDISLETRTGDLTLKIINMKMMFHSGSIATKSYTVRFSVRESRCQF